MNRQSSIVGRAEGRRRPAAYFAPAAFLFTLFNYLGVSYLLPGLHSYA